MRKFFIYSVPSLFFLSDSASLKCLILSDSIAKYVSGISDARVIAFPGINISRMTQKVQSRRIEISARNVIFHVGTNDICRMDVGEMLSAFNNLITVTKDLSNANVLISAILPRPIDWDASDDKVKMINKKLVELCKDRNIRFLHTYKYFVKSGRPKRELFAIRDGGLHLNLEGTKILKKLFVNVVAHLSG